MKVFVLSCISLFFPIILSAQAPLSLSSWESRVRSNLTVLDRHGKLAEQLRYGEDGLYLYASARDKQRNRPEIHLRPEEIRTFIGMCERLPMDELLAEYRAKGTRPWGEDKKEAYSLTPWRPEPNGSFPLRGLKVALDPGHLGSSLELAELEGKYVKVKATDTREGMAFWEGDLNLATAHLVRYELEKLGATVMMTREKRGQSAMGPLYEDWRKNYFLSAVDREVKARRMSTAKAQFWRKEATENDIFRRFFNILDLRTRAEKINAFQPDLTLIIHYNVDKDNWDRRDRDGFFEPGFANYSMTFVPGNFRAQDLKSPQGRVNFLRLLVSPHLQESIRLSALYLKANTYFTHVPIVDKQKEPDYLINFCTPTKEPGVYGRNLALTRLVHSPLCYGESLCQDNWRELLWLNKRDMRVEDIPISSRVKTVAAAYVQAVKEFVGVE